MKDIVAPDNGFPSPSTNVTSNGVESPYFLVRLDADKTDNFRVKAEEDFENIIDNASKDILENDIISENIFNDFMKSKIIVRKDRKTYMDFWVSYIAFIFDYNYKYGLEYIKEKNYINIIIDRLGYKNEDTRNKMKMIRNHTIEFIDNNI